MALTASDMFRRPTIKIRFQSLAFARGHGAVGMPAPLIQHHASLSQRIAGLTNLLGAVAVEVNLIGRELLLKSPDVALHKAQLTVVVKTHPHMLGYFAAD